jgi:endo-1,4-beta-xylanase
MRVRGHNLIWPSWNFSGHLKPLQNDPPALASHILDHIKDEVGTLKGQCFEWDVMNEAYNNHDVQDILGPHCVVDWYNAAHAADPQARLFINDYGITEANGDDTKHIDAYDAQIQYLLDNKAPLGGIGLQSHFSRILTAPDKVYAILNRFARFGLPLEVTEFDVNIPDEQLKSDYLRDYMTIVFSHPAASGFVMWGFWAGDHWLPDAALWRKDFSVNPNGHMYQDLVFHQWWTDTTGKSSTGGQFATRAFLGDYQITATQGGRTKTVPVSVTKNGSETTVVTMTL